MRIGKTVRLVAVVLTGLSAVVRCLNDPAGSGTEGIHGTWARRGEQVFGAYDTLVLNHASAARLVADHCVYKAEYSIGQDRIFFTELRLVEKREDDGGVLSGIERLDSAFIADLDSLDCMPLVDTTSVAYVLGKGTLTLSYPSGHGDTVYVDYRRVLLGR